MSGCADLGNGLGFKSRADTANMIASQSGMKRQTIDATPFRLTVYTRITRPGGDADVYIEGDGFAWLDRETPSGDPTPKNPMGLRLAAADPAQNVIYLARPCQYSGMTDGAHCPARYWTDARLAPDVVAALGKALDNLEAENHLRSYSLTGFSGGGGAAVILAARRHDVTALRTVAGNLNQKLFSRIHDVSPMDVSLDPVDFAAQTAHIPQIHFAGADDKIVPPSIAESFRQAAGADERCITLKIVPGMAHDSGWAEAWPDLLTTTFACR